MEEDPAFYRRFSEMLEATIRDYRDRRISERDYLASVIELASRVAHKDHGRDVPPSIKGNDDAQAFFGVLQPELAAVAGPKIDRAETADIALAIIAIIKKHHIVGAWSNDIAQNNMRNAIDDYFFDVLRDEKGISLPLDTMDGLELKLMDLARARFPG